MEKFDNTLACTFALNALNDSEREEALQQAQSSHAVREEFDSLQETAALLGLLAEAEVPPPGVKANIMSAIRTTPQLPPLEAEAESVAAANPKTSSSPSAGASTAEQPSAQENIPATPAASKTNQQMFALAAGVLLIASGVLTGVVINQNAQQQELEQNLIALSDQQAQLTRILMAEDAKSKTQKMEDGAQVNLAYSAAEGMMAVTTAGLPELPVDKGYELWLISSAGAVSAGMVDGTRADGTVVVSGSMEGVTHFGITVEPATGSPAPTTTPILVQTL